MHALSLTHKHTNILDTSLHFAHTRESKYKEHCVSVCFKY